MKVSYIFGSIGLAAALTLTACGGAGGNTTAAQSPAGAGAATTLQVEAESTGAMAFKQTTMEAPARQEFAVTFTNPAPLQHNWVLVEPGQEQAVVDGSMAKNGDVSGVAGVIAPGAVLDGGGTETLTVPAQEAGSYPYICTVPGHYAAGMKGTLNVK